MSSLPIMDMQNEYIKKPETPERSPAARILKIIIVILLVFFVGEIAYYLLFSTSFRIEKIEVSAPRSFPLSNKAIVELSGFKSGVSVFNVKTEELEAGIETHPSVLSADVHAQFPNTLTISVSGRVPVAAIISGEESRLYYVDKQGVLFQHPGFSEGLPVLSGVKSESIDYGYRLHEYLKPMLEDLAELKNSSSVIYELLSEIHVQRIGEEEFDGWVYFSHSKLKVRTDLIFTKEHMENVILVMDLIQKQGIAPRVEELDFRSGSLVLKMREE